MPNAASMYKALGRQEEVLTSRLSYFEDTSSDEFRIVERQLNRARFQRKAVASFLTDLLDANVRFGTATTDAQPGDLVEVAIGDDYPARHNS